MSLIKFLFLSNYFILVDFSGKYARYRYVFRPEVTLICAQACSKFIHQACANISKRLLIVRSLKAINPTLHSRKCEQAEVETVNLHNPPRLAFAIRGLCMHRYLFFVTKALEIKKAELSRVFQQVMISPMHPVLQSRSRTLQRQSNSVPTT